MDLSPSKPAATAGELPFRPEPADPVASPSPPPPTAGEPGDAAPAAAAEDAGEFGPLLLPAGLPGFPDARTFHLRRLPGAGEFAILEAVEPEGPRFVVLEVVEPEAVFGPAATAEAAEALGIERADLLLLAIVTLSDGPAGRRAHVNLRAPVAVDRVGRTARQLVLADPGLPLRHPLEPRAAA